MDISVSGKTFYGALDPLATDFPREQLLPVPASQKVGKGMRFRYTGLSRVQVEAIARHLRVLGDVFTIGADIPEARAEGRAFYRDADKIDSLLRG